MADFNDVLYEIEEMVEEAFNVPLSGGKCLVKGEELRSLVEELRLNLPIEMKKALNILAERDRILEKAKKEHDAKIAAAESKAQYLLNNDRITKQAAADAAAIVKNAEEEAAKIKKAAQDYVEISLRKAEETLTQSVASIKQARSLVREKPVKGPFIDN